MAVIFSDYVAIQDEDTARRIMHMLGIIAYITAKANELKEDTGSPNFEVIVSQNPAFMRPRAYVKPLNNDGIREELVDAVLSKAALGMTGR